jgi:hypothetical protein
MRRDVLAIADPFEDRDGSLLALPLCNDWTNGLPEIRHTSAGPHKRGHPGPVVGTQRYRAFTSGGVRFAAMARPHHSADLKRGNQGARNGSDHRHRNRGADRNPPRPP